jgi:hypothetical protein
MRKKIIFLSLVFILSVSMVFAQGIENKSSDAGNPESTQENKGNDQESQQGSTVQENQPESSQGDGANESVQEQSQVQNQEQEGVNEQTGESNGETVGEQIRQQVRAVNIEQLKEMIKNKKQEINQEFQALKDKKQKAVYQNQNTVREAVHALLASEDLVGGVGPQISEIAREFNNSVQKTIQAEEKIQKRNMVVGFFFGGDEEAAEDILQETNKNKEKIQQLKDLKQQCDCDEEVKNVIQEQIQNIEQEQNRLGQLAQKEKSNKGLFGWLFGWLRK